MSYLKQKNKYKNILRQGKKKYFHSIYSQLEDIDPDDLKELWRTINRMKKVNEKQDNPITSDDWDQYFNKLLKDNSYIKENTADSHFSNADVNKDNL